MYVMQHIATLEEMAAPFVALNKIALGYTEKLVDINFAIARKQVDLFLAGWRECIEVKGPEEAKEYLSYQGEVARKAVEEYVADAKAVSALNQEVAADVRKVVEDSLAKASEKAV